MNILHYKNDHWKLVISHLLKNMSLCASIKSEIWQKPTDVYRGNRADFTHSTLGGDSYDCSSWMASNCTSCYYNNHLTLKNTDNPQLRLNLEQGNFHSNYWVNNQEGYPCWLSVKSKKQLKPVIYLQWMSSYAPATWLCSYYIVTSHSISA